MTRRSCRFESRAGFGGCRTGVVIPFEVVVAAYSWSSCRHSPDHRGLQPQARSAFPDGMGAATTCRSQRAGGLSSSLLQHRDACLELRQEFCFLMRNFVDREQEQGEHSLELGEKHGVERPLLRHVTVVGVD